MGLFIIPLLALAFAAFILAGVFLTVASAFNLIALQVYGLVLRFKNRSRE